ncbi:LAFE_0G10858g1_1 [Lachancea fermentati]|uniref:LAFE_0G10858g1_1 n=1 Tax=Lachancea fermentati TaxID=4955 RepID=A0A1G4MI27_LACFM|nr:LAFE_0G10858g1_1 [Lachancea fermentati]
MSVNTPSLFDMTSLEPQPDLELSVQPSAAHRDSHTIVGELVFDKFAQKDPVVGVKKEEEDHTPLLSFDLQLTEPAMPSEELQPDVVEAFFSSTDSTPMFEFETLESDPKAWSSLFNDDIPVTVADAAQVVESVEREPVAETAAPATTIDTKSFLPTPVIEDAKLQSKKKRASTSGAVQKPEKVDRLGVIAYNRKSRASPLTPVIPESDDPVALKRARNTEAARRSRARKLQRMNQLEEKVEDLLQRNSELENEVARLRALLGGQC